MSEPTRYAFRLCEDNDAIYLGAKEQSDGQYVLYADYARLKAEVESYEVASVHTCSRGCQKPGCPRKYLDEIADLKAEVERLTKAGNNLVYVASEHPVAEPFVKAWLAAKEGKPSV